MRQKRLRQKYDELSRNWDRVTDKIGKLREEQILESRRSEQMRIGQQIADLEEIQAEIEIDLEEIERLMLARANYRAGIGGVESFRRTFRHIAAQRRQRDKRR